MSIFHYRYSKGGVSGSPSPTWKEEWQALLEILHLRKPPPPPPIITPYGPQTEWVRKQAAINMKLDPAIKERVERIFIQRAEGDVIKGVEESKKHYPEAY